MIDYADVARRWEGHYDWDRYFEARKPFCTGYAWAIPELEIMDTLADRLQDKAVLEVGAGSGLWAAMLAQRGVAILATDNYSWSKPWADGSPPQQIGVFYPVLKLSAGRAVKRFPGADVLFLCWPPYDMPMADTALKLFTGSEVVYIGEGEMGCTGDSRFHNRLNREWVREDALFIPQWNGMHDRVHLYHRKCVPGVPYPPRKDTSMERPRVIITVLHGGAIQFIDADGQVDVLEIEPYEGDKYPTAYQLDENETVRQVRGRTVVVRSHPPFSGLPQCTFDQAWREAVGED